MPSSWVAPRLVSALPSTPPTRPVALASDAGFIDDNEPVCTPPSVMPLLPGSTPCALTPSAFVSSVSTSTITASM